MSLAAWLLWGLLFSSIGLGYFLYGKKQARVVPLVCGIVLMVYPYAVSSALWMILLGVVFTAVPWLARSR